MTDGIWYPGMEADMRAIGLESDIDMINRLKAENYRLRASLEQIKSGSSINANIRSGWMSRARICQIATEALIG